MPWEWTVNEAVPAHFFKPALEADEENERRQQSLLHPSCSHVETTILYASVALPVPLDGTIITSSTIFLIPTSRGTVTLSSGSVNDPPIIHPNYYSTQADRTALIYGTRHGIGLIYRKGVAHTLGCEALAVLAVMLY